MKVGVYQGSLDLQGFSAPRCRSCRKPLDRVIKTSTPYLLETTFAWDILNAKWEIGAKRVEAHPERKPIEHYACGECGARIRGQVEHLLKNNESTKIVDIEFADAEVDPELVTAE